MTRQLYDLAYNDSQSLDLHLVETGNQPLVVCIHGGGFISGSRADERCIQAAQLINAAGINCASISYSLATAGQRFSMWPRNLFDVADAISFLHDQSDNYGYDFKRLGMLGFSAGCCLANLYIQGGDSLFDYFGYEVTCYRPGVLVGFYGPYDFAIRQAERRSDDHRINRDHSPSFWLQRNDRASCPPVLHIHGDQDDIVYPDQHERFKKDYEARNCEFTSIIAKGFAHSFSPRDTNAAGRTIDLGPEISAFLSHHLLDKKA